MSTTNFPWWQPQVGTSEYALVRQVLDSNYLNDGRVTTQFEKLVADHVGCKYAVAVTSGTMGIFAGLAASGVGAGDEVLVPDVTFIATANAVTLTGATPVLVDVEPGSLNLCPQAASRAITPKTKGIVPVHVSGRAADMNAIMELARCHSLVVVEDAAEALGSRHRGQALGTIGHAGAISLSPNKMITTGQGGVVLTNDSALHTRLRELKDQGRATQGTGGDDRHPVLGYNLKFTNLQAAVGIAQFEMLVERQERLRRTYEIYRNELGSVGGIRFPGFDLAGGEIPQWVDVIAEDRDALHDHLLARGMHCRRFWFPLHTQNPYRRADSEFPVSTKVMPAAMWLPSAFTLADSDVKSVCGEICTFYQTRSATRRAA